MKKIIKLARQKNYRFQSIILCIGNVNKRYCSFRRRYWDVTL